MQRDLNPIFLVIVVTIVIASFVTGSQLADQLTFLWQSENRLRNLSVFLIVIILAIISVFTVFFFASTYIRSLWSAVFSLCLLSSLTFSNIMGNIMTLGDVRKLWVDAGFALPAFLFYYSELIWPAVATILFFLSFILYHRRRRSGASWPVQSALAILPILPFGMMTGMLTVKGGAAGVGLPALYSPAALAMSILIEEARAPDITKDALTYSGAFTPQIGNIVLIVDESVSHDFITLEDPSLVPTLTANADRIADFGYATAGHNCSSYSNAILRWGVRADSLVNAERKPTIWQFAEAAGYKTTYIDSQKQPGTLGNFMGMDEFQYINNVVQFASPQLERGDDYIRNDFQAAEEIVEIITKSTGNFIFLNKLGVHFPYEGKYPEQSAEYLPKMSLWTSIGHTTKEMLTNSYKNAIQWNVDGFMTRLLDEADLTNTLIIYTSDHGQNLLDSGTPTHCSRDNTSPYEGLVPLLTMTDHPRLRAQFQQQASINQNLSSHYNLFPTLLSLFGFEHDYVAAQHGQHLLEKLKPIGAFAKGDLFSTLDADRDYLWQVIEEAPVNRSSVR